MVLFIKVKDKETVDLEGTKDNSFGFEYAKFQTCGRQIVFFRDGFNFILYIKCFCYNVIFVYLLLRDGGLFFFFLIWVGFYDGYDKQYMMELMLYDF